MKRPNKPVMLDDYVRHRRRKGRLHRCLCAASFLLAAAALRVFCPASAQTVRAWVFGDGTVNEAVEAFYACAERGAPLPDAVEAMCLALDGD